MIWLKKYSKNGTGETWLCLRIKKPHLSEDKARCDPRLARLSLKGILFLDNSKASHQCLLGPMLFSNQIKWQKIKMREKNKVLKC